MRFTRKYCSSGAMLILVVILAYVTNARAQTTPVPVGQKLEVNGIITSRGADTFTVRTLDKANTYNVAIGSETSVKSNTKGIFRGGNRYDAGYLLRGLRVQVVGNGNDAGELVADTVRFNEQDLKTAQSLEARMEPYEDQTKANTEAISANKQAISSNSERITAGEENAKRMSGQIDENTALAQRAQAEADRANNRINGLGEFDTIKTIVVTFAVGSSTLGPKGRATIDEAAAWVKTQDRKGWMVEVVGYADSTGNTAKNKTLSEKRANAVIGYLVSKYNLPLHRLIQPFGAGVDKPAATNETAEGRAQNRRVEIKLLKNKGIAGE